MKVKLKLQVSSCPAPQSVLLLNTARMQRIAYYQFLALHHAYHLQVSTPILKPLVERRHVALHLERHDARNSDKYTFSPPPKHATQVLHPDPQNPSFKDDVSRFIWNVMAVATAAGGGRGAACDPVTNKCPEGQVRTLCVLQNDFT